MVTDPESDGDKVLEFVGGLMSRLEGLHKKAFTYKSYQKTFKACTAYIHVWEYLINALIGEADWIHAAEVW